jgi:hypothetical protein
MMPDYPSLSTLGGALRDRWNRAGSFPVTTSTGVTITPEDIQRGMDLGMSFSGGGLGTIKAYPGLSPQFLPENPSIPRAVNDPGLMNLERAPNYEAARRQQQIIKAGKDAEIGDIDYWQKIADEEGHKIGSFTNPYKAAKERSKGGQSTILIDPEGRRVLYTNGQRLNERYSDIPK